MAWHTSLRSIENFLASHSGIAALTNADDLILSREDYDFLHQTFGERAFLFPRGGHGGNLQHQTVVERMLSFIQGE